MANQLRQLRDLLVEDGVRVAVVATNGPAWPSAVERVRGLRALLRLFPYARALWSLAATTHVLHLLANSGWSWHLFAVPAIVIARLRRRPIIINYRGGGAERFLQRQWRVVIPVLRLARAVVVPSSFLYDVFQKYGIESVIIANAVDTRYFFPSSRVPSATGYLLVTRNLEQIYDVETAIRAFAIVRENRPDVHLVIAGDGPQRPHLEALASSLGIESAIHFKGRVSREEVGELLRGARVWLNPSLVDNMPNSLLEAFVTGVAVVSTGAGGIKRILDDEETGLLVPPSDPQVMAAAVLRLLSDEALALRIGENARRAAQKYAWSAISREWLRLYRTASIRGAPTRSRQ